MKKFTFTFYLPSFKIAFYLLLLMGVVLTDSKAQYRDYGLAFSENLKGGTAIFGNTLMNLINADGSINTIAMNGNSVNGNSLYDNGSFGMSNMQYVDIDGSTGDGAGTRNSSSADLILPGGTNTIKLARLYWGGRVMTSDFDIKKAVNQTIKIRKENNGAYEEHAAAQLDKNVQNAGLNTEFSFYQAFADITTLVKQKGAGTYTVGNGAFSTGMGGDFGNYGAWSIVVVYENPALNFNSVRIYDGFQQIYNGGASTTTDITLTGLNVPSGALSSSDAKVGIITWEGDAKYNGDFFKINGNLFSNAINQPDNAWNGTISNNGVHVTSKNPDYTDQMGIDIDQFDVGTGYGILPNAANVTLQFGTNDDQFFCGVVAFVIKMKDPAIRIFKTVADASNNKTAEPGEILTYTLKGKNIGAGNANAVVLIDSLPSSVRFLSNSLKVNYGPGVSTGTKTNGAGDDIAEYNPSGEAVVFRMGNNATAVNGGFLEPNDSFEVEFKVIVNPNENGLGYPVINIGRLVSLSDAGQEFADETTAVIYLPAPPTYKDIYVPKAFTPNNDNLNDQWRVPALAWYPLAEVRIYNRYGQLIFYNKGYTKQWDGRFKGLNEPMGVYIYTIDLKNGSKLLSGTVALLR